jgi:hypothetical protein
MSDDVVFPPPQFARYAPRQVALDRFRIVGRTDGPRGDAAALLQEWLADYRRGRA